MLTGVCATVQVQLTKPNDPYLVFLTDPLQSHRTSSQYYLSRTIHFIPNEENILCSRAKAASFPSNSLVLSTFGPDMKLKIKFSWEMTLKPINHFMTSYQKLNREAECLEKTVPFSMNATREVGLITKTELERPLLIQMSNIWPIQTLLRESRNVKGWKQSPMKKGLEKEAFVFGDLLIKQMELMYWKQRRRKSVGQHSHNIYFQLGPLNNRQCLPLWPNRSRFPRSIDEHLTFYNC